MAIDEVAATSLARVLELEKKVNDKNGDMSIPVTSIIDQVDDIQTVRDHYYQEMKTSIRMNSVLKEVRGGQQSSADDLIKEIVREKQQEKELL